MKVQFLSRPASRKEGEEKNRRKFGSEWKVSLYAALEKRKVFDR